MGLIAVIMLAFASALVMAGNETDPSDQQTGS